MDAQDGDGKLTLDLIDLAGLARRAREFADQPFSSPIKDERSAWARIRNQLRQAVAALEAAAEASRRLT